MPSSGEIRTQFVDFFCKKHGHRNVPSSPVVPVADRTLLFTNAGMNQFKPYFLGTEKPPVTRVANTQKCIRAGGKHNDLDDVGKDTYHHTFFEMLGNWSFGDYFKADAIAWAWELLTDVWKLDPERLHVTVFEGDPANGIPRDTEAESIWQGVGVRPGHVHTGNKKDNFWEMGATGPCGPCTEVHYDHTPDLSGGPLVNRSSDQVIEIWNLVFIQFNRNEDQSLTPLPARHVDTGMGFERVTKVLQKKASNYDTDVFTPLLAAIGAATGRTYGGNLTDPTDTGFRVIADHLRMATFAVTDGARPGAKGRDSVVRSVIRRAVRYGYLQFDRREPFVFDLVPTLVDQMSGAFPELRRDPAGVMDVIRREEKDFFRTVAGGIKRFESVIGTMTGGVFAGAAAADLNQTYGFPVDLTAQLAGERGLTVDVAGVDKSIEAHKKESGKGRVKLVVSAIRGELPATDDAPKYGPPVLEATVAGWVVDNQVITAGAVQPGDAVALLIDRTNFYAEQGGQVGDTGTVTTAAGADFEVEDTQRLGAAVVHTGVLHAGELRVGDRVTLRTAPRADTERNHTATHLLNLALRRVLGPHVEQKGSLVDGEKTRFDFAHDAPLTPEQLRAIEALVNEKLGADLAVTATVMPLGTAKDLPGVRAVFGEKYPDPVRVVAVGPDSLDDASADDSVEFCGGTHVQRTGSIGLFRVTSQEGVAKGIRRITAVTGRRATAAAGRLAAVVDDLAAKFQCPPDDLPARVQALQDELTKLRAAVKKSEAAGLAGTVDKLLADATEVNGSALVVGELPGATFDLARDQINRVRQLKPSSLVVFAWSDDAGKVTVLAAVTHDLIKKGLKAGDVVKDVAAVVGGSGGGKPDLAQAGGKDAAKLPAALARARELGRELLGL